MEDHDPMIRDEKLKKQSNTFRSLMEGEQSPPLTYLDPRFIALKHYWQSNMLETSGNNSGKEQYSLGPDLKCSFHILALNQLTR